MVSLKPEYLSPCSVCCGVGFILRFTSLLFQEDCQHLLGYMCHPASAGSVLMFPTRQARLCCRNTQHQHPSDLTQQKFMNPSYKVHYRSRELSRTGTAPQCWVLGIPDCSEFCLLSLCAYMAKAGKDSIRVLHQQINVSAKKWDHCTQPTAQNYLWTLTARSKNI